MKIQRLELKGHVAHELALTLPGDRLIENLGEGAPGAWVPFAIAWGDQSGG